MGGGNGETFVLCSKPTQPYLMSHVTEQRERGELEQKWAGEGGGWGKKEGRKGEGGVKTKEEENKKKGLRGQSQVCLKTF